jgi:hypothetical protein
VQDILIPVTGMTDLLNMGDVTAPKDSVTMNWYRLDATAGNWQTTRSEATVLFKWPCGTPKVERPRQGPLSAADSMADWNGEPPENRALLRTYRTTETGNLEAWVSASRSFATVDEMCRPVVKNELIDIRANALKPCKPAPPSPPPPMPPMTCEQNITRAGNYAVLGDYAGSGWFAWGISVRDTDTTCFKLTAKDSCGRPVAGALFSAKGRYQPYRVEAYTKMDGTACLESIASEPNCTGTTVDPACDFNYNDLGGELFWLNMSVTKKGLGPAKTIQNQEIPNSRGRCSNPDSCIPIEHTFEVRSCQ